MNKDKQIINIIIPTYNEEENIGLMLHELFEVAQKSQINVKVTVVDDSSSDRTADLVKETATKYSVNILQRRNVKRSLSASILEGIKASEEEYIGVMDADLSHPPDCLPWFYNCLVDEGYDFVIGSRYVKNGGIKGWPLGRRFLSKAGCLLADVLLGTKVKDPISGLFFLKKNVVNDINTPPGGFKICLDIIARGKYNKVKEIGYCFVDRQKGRSKMTFRIAKEYLNQLWKLCLKR